MAKDEIPKELLLVVFISGACAMVVEIAGARIIAPYLGNTIYTWTAVIGLVLGALSLGYYIGGSIADRYNDRRHLSTILLLAGIATIAVPMLGNTIIPVTLFLDLIPASLIASFVLVPASLLYGMVSPYIIKLTSEKAREGKSAGRIFAISTAGSIGGVLGTGFVLIPNLLLTHIFIMAGVLMVLMSWTASRKGKAFIVDLPLVIMLALISSAFNFVPLVQGEVVHEEESAYYNIKIMDVVINEEPARIMFLDNERSSAERSDGEPAFSYVLKSRTGYELADDVENCLVIGVAAGTHVEELKEEFPGAHVDGVDIDERAVELGKEYFSLEDDERTEIIIDDARRYVKRTNRTYELVVIDAFRSNSIPQHLATEEFLWELKEKMSDDGVIVLNVISAAEGEKSAVFIRIYNTFAAVFDNIVVMPLKEDPETLQNILIIATDADVDAFTEKYSEEIYGGEIAEAEPLRDELNPIELYVSR